MENQVNVTKVKKKDNLIILLFKKVKLSSLILLVISLCFNAYAWFIYATKVSTGIEAYVTSWNVTFQSGADESTTNVSIDIEDIYPGMTTWTREIGVTNKGETAASLNYLIQGITVLGQTYTVGVDGVTDETIKTLISNFPFKIEIIVDTGTLDLTDGTGKFVINVSWDFESGNDELDTQWGQDAYTFKQVNPGTSCIHIDLQLQAVQV